ncbi:MAG TPA: Ig-like domain-containing protein [Bryobacteraceae bacterium]|nr:Ig-like domain-containing protein [Bryobacteraceae bacterium]
MKFALLALLLPIYGAPAGVSIHLEGGAFQVEGWHADREPAQGWGSIFDVYVDSGAPVPPMFGSYSVDRGKLIFRPQFPLTAGVRYRAVFHAPGTETVEASFKQPLPPAGPPARVAAVYPSADVLPANQLKFYVYFSEPMQSGSVWAKIHLLDENGQPVALPFLEIEPELWDRDFKRLTILFDPGRIKRGVLPRERMGPALIPGKRYTLAIGRGLLDARGNPLAQAFRKQFTAGPEERRSIDPKHWKVTEPQAGTLDPLKADFGRPLDYALLQHAFKIASVPGAAMIARHETEWSYRPTEPWKAGEYRLIVDMALEDLAGNRIGRPFDVDLLHDPAPRIVKQSASLVFRVRRGSAAKIR